MNQKVINVAAAILIENREVLIACRGSGSLEGFWEFPGGKIEDNESAQQCLVREIKEELDNDISVGNFFGTSEYTMPDRSVVLNAYVCSRRIKNQFKLHVHSAVAWVDILSIDLYTFAPADIPLVKKLKSTLLLNVE